MNLFDRIARRLLAIAPFMIPFTMAITAAAAVLGFTVLVDDRNEGAEARKHIQAVLAAQQRELIDQQRHEEARAERMQRALDFIRDEFERMEASNHARHQALLHEIQHLRAEAAAHHQAADVVVVPVPRAPAPAQRPPPVPRMHHPRPQSPAVHPEPEPAPQAPGRSHVRPLCILDLICIGGGS